MPSDQYRAAHREMQSLVDMLFDNAESGDSSRVENVISAASAEARMMFWLNSMTIMMGLEPESPESIQEQVSHLMNGGQTTLGELVADIGSMSVEGQDHALFLLTHHPAAEVRQLGGVIEGVLGRSGASLPAPPTAPTTKVSPPRSVQTTGGSSKAMEAPGVLGAKGGDSVAGTWIRRAADHGDSDAMYTLGNEAYAKGDRATARNWFRRAADLGNAAAINGLGWLADEDGDRATALTWYRRAADHGDAGAMHVLGVIASADGDWSTACTWFRRAVDLGDPHSGEALPIAELRLAELRERGEFEAAPWTVTRSSAQPSGDLPPPAGHPTGPPPTGRDTDPAMASPLDRAMSLVRKAEALTAAGNPPAAREAANRARATADTIADPVNRTEALAQAAEALAAAGDPAAALKAANRARYTANNIADPSLRGKARLQVAEVLDRVATRRPTDRKPPEG